MEGPAFGRPARTLTPSMLNNRVKVLTLIIANGSVESLNLLNSCLALKPPRLERGFVTSDVTSDETDETRRVSRLT